MRRNQPKPSSGILTLRHFVSLATLLSAVVLYTGCGSQQTQQTGGSNQANTNTTPKPSPSPADNRSLGDTPIVISGGSVQLEFSHTLFSGSGGTYTVAGNVLTDGTIYDNSPGNNPNPDIALPIPANGMCTITVRGKAPGGQTQDLIVIESKASPSSVTVRFNEGNYPRRNSKSNLHTNRNDQIEEIVVKDDNAGGTTTTFDQQHGLPANGKITLEVFGKQ